MGVNVRSLSAVLSPKECPRPDNGLASFPGLPSLHFGMAQFLHTTSIASFPGSPHYGEESLGMRLLQVTGSWKGD